MKKLLFIGNPSILDDNLDVVLKEDYKLAFMSDMPSLDGSLQFTAYHSIILDFEMLKEKSFVLCKIIKVSAPQTIVMFLYPVDVSEQILLNGYDSGADDYLYTTLSSANLLLKKLNQLSTRKNLTTKYEDSRMTLNFDTLTAVIDDAVVDFTPLEFKLLKLFTLNSHTVLTRQYILYFLWDRNGNYVEETSLNSMICRIRQRIDNEKHHYIKTIYGIGYMWISYLI